MSKILFGGEGLGLKVQGVRFKVKGLGFGIQGLGLRGQGATLFLPEPCHTATNWKAENESASCIFPRFFHSLEE